MSYQHTTVPCEKNRFLKIELNSQNFEKRAIFLTATSYGDKKYECFAIEKL